MENTVEVCKQTTKDFFPRKHSWSRVKTEYVEGCITEEGNQIWPTMKQLSLKHVIPFAYLRRVASEQKWTIEKNNFITNYEHAQQQEKIKYLSKKSAKFDNKCIKLAEEGVKRIEQYLCDPVIDDNGAETKIVLTIDDLELAAKTLEKFQKIGRLGLGNSTDNITKSIKAGIENMSFSEGLDLVARQIQGNPDLMKKIESDIVDK